MSKTYNFKKQINPYDYNPSPNLFKFYQICAFKNPWTNKYCVRKCSANENGEIVESHEKKYCEKQYNKLLKMCKINEYKIYSTYDLNLVDYPNGEDLSVSRSSILNDISNYSGFAPF